MKVKVLLVEDEPMIAQDLELTLEENNYEVIGPYYEAQSALEAAQKEKPDVALLDINLQTEVDGINIAEKLDANCAILFITSLYDSTTLRRIVRLNPQAYILKPFQEQEVLMNIKLALAKKEVKSSTSSGSNHMMIKEQGLYMKVETKDILYLKGENNYTRLVLTNAKSHLLSKTLSSVLKEERMLHEFIRIHKSYAVNLNHLEGVNGKSALIDGNTLPIGRAYKRDFLETWNK